MSIKFITSRFLIITNTKGFGVVRKAVFEGGVVAVKSLQLETSTMDALKSIQMFAAEAEKMRNVRHPCIVEFKGFVLEMFAIVMQFMPDGTLYDYIKQSKNEMPWVERFWCAVDVADGMAFLHSSGLFHQDLKSLK